MASITVENTCRLCTKRGTDYHAIFTSNSSSISDKINNCLPIVISADDGLPSHICPTCLTALNTSDALRAQCLIADEFLRKKLSPVFIKDEHDISDNEKDISDDEAIQRASNEICCGICEVHFTDANTFDDHMKKYHSSQWICNLCDEDFKTSDALLQHKHVAHYDVPHSGDKAETSSNARNKDGSGDPLDSDYSGTASAGEDDSVECGNSAEKPTPCDICQVMIQTEKLMAMHKKFHEPRQMYCTHCCKSYPTPYDLFRHKQDAHKMFLGKTMKWFCEHCGRFSPNPRFLKNHAACKKIRFKCKYCNQEYTKQRDLILHQKKYHLANTLNDPDIPKYQCPTCEKSYIDKGNFRSHVRMHRVRLERRYACTQCNASFLSVTQLKGHLDDIHLKNRDWLCEVCEKTFTSQRSLRAHSKRHKDSTCQECGKLFENMRLLNQHLRGVHNIATPATGNFVCKDCGKKFSKLRLLKDHRNVHSGKRPHVCNICNATFRTYAARWSHIQKHINDGFYCDYCKRRFSTKGHVRRHLFSHLPPENWNYKCKVCSERFYRKSHLITHMKKHDETRPYSCDQCDAKFVKEKLLLQHLNTEHKEDTKEGLLTSPNVPEREEVFFINCNEAAIKVDKSSD